VIWTGVALQAAGEVDEQLVDGDFGQVLKRPAKPAGNDLLGCMPICHWTPALSCDSSA